MKVFVLFCTFVYAASSASQLSENLENVQVVIDKISSSKLLQSTQKLVESIGLSGKISSNKLEKINSFVDKVSKLTTTIDKTIEKFGKLAKIIGPAGDAFMVAVSLFSEEAEDKFEKYFQGVFEKIDAVEAKLNDVAQKIVSLDAKLSEITSQIKLETKFSNFFLIYTKMSSSFETFETSVLIYIDIQQEFSLRLDAFIKTYETENFEFQLVNIATSSVAGFKSLMDAFKDVSLESEKSDNSPTVSSTSKSIYEFYVLIMMRVFDGFSLLKLCYMLQNEIKGGNTTHQGRTLTDRKAKTIPKLIAAMKASLSHASVDSYRNLNKNEEPVRLLNVLQYFWEHEEILSKEDTCTGTCEDYQDSLYEGGDGCFGAVRDCQFKYSVHKTEYQLRQRNPKTDRIYEGYSLNDKWYGRNLETDSSHKSVSKLSWLKGFVICHVCQCVCDQFNNEITTRKFYIGKVEAPDGFVITGVRFKERNHAIFLQIEVGLLLPLGMVDSTTIRWQDLPEIIYGDLFYHFGYDNRKFLLSDVSFDNKCLTGVQFVNSGGVLSVRIFGKNIESLTLGKMGTDESSLDSSVSTKEPKKLNNTIPGLSPSASPFSIEKLKVIEFGLSDEEVDAGQSFVPYFDSGNVAFDVRSPVSGLGFFHFTNNEKYAGFIRPYLKSLKYADFIYDLKNDDPSLQVFVPVSLSSEQKPTSSGILAQLSPIALLLILTRITHVLLC